MTTPADEAAAILIRILNAIAAVNGKRLKPEQAAELRRACELLALNGALEPLDDLPRTTPGERASTYAAVPLEVERWRRQRSEEANQ